VADAAAADLGFGGFAAAEFFYVVFVHVFKKFLVLSS
jgi:hypothetical protein